MRKGTIKYKASNGKVYEIDYDVSIGKPSKAEMEEYVQSRLNETTQQKLDRESEELREFFRKNPYIKYDGGKKQEQIKSVVYKLSPDELMVARMEGIPVGPDGSVEMDYEGDTPPSYEEQHQYFVSQAQQARRDRGYGTPAQVPASKVPMVQAFSAPSRRRDEAAEYFRGQQQQTIRTPFQAGKFIGDPILNAVYNAPEAVGGVGGAMLLPALAGLLVPGANIPIGISLLLGLGGALGGTYLAGEAKREAFSRINPSLYARTERELGDYTRRDPFGSMISQNIPNFAFGGPGAMVTRADLLGSGIGAAIGAGTEYGGAVAQGRDPELARILASGLLGAFSSHDTAAMRALQPGAVRARPGGYDYTPSQYSDYGEMAKWRSLDRMMGNARGEYNLLNDMGLAGLDRTAENPRANYPLMAELGLPADTSRLLGGESSNYPRNVRQDTSHVLTGMRDMYGSWAAGRNVDPSGVLGNVIPKTEIARAFQRWKNRPTRDGARLDANTDIYSRLSSVPALLTDSPMVSPGESAQVPALTPEAGGSLLEPPMQAPALVDSEPRQVPATDPAQTVVPPSDVTSAPVSSASVTTPVNPFTLPIQSNNRASRILTGRRPNTEMRQALATILGEHGIQMPQRQPVQAPASLPPPRVENGVRIEGRPEPRTAITPGRQNVPFHYGVAEAEELITSHDLDTKEREDFAQEMQPRGRENDANTINQINDIANNMSPYELGTTDFTGSATQGPPIIGKDRRVESGNGRTLGILKGYLSNTKAAQAYRQQVMQTAKELGIDVSDMRNPVLVRIRSNELTREARQALANDMNGQTGMRLSPREQARVDVNSVRRSPEGNVFSRLNPTAQGGLTTGNEDFGVGFARAVGSNELAGLISHDRSGEVTSEGAKRINNAIVMYAYGDTALSHFLIEGDHKNVESVVGALKDAAPFFARSRAMMERGQLDSYYDPTPVIEDTINNIKRIYDASSRLKGKDRLAKAYDAWEASTQTGTDSLMDEYGSKDESVYLTKAFMNRGPHGAVYSGQADYVDFFREYNESWQQQGTTGPSLGFSEPVDRFSLIKMADAVAAGANPSQVEITPRETTTPEPMPTEESVQAPAPDGQSPKPTPERWADAITDDKWWNYEHDRKDYGFYTREKAEEIKRDVEKNLGPQTIIRVPHKNSHVKGREYAGDYYFVVGNDYLDLSTKPDKAQTPTPEETVQPEPISYPDTPSGQAETKFRSNLSQEEQDFVAGLNGPDFRFVPEGVVRGEPSDKLWSQRAKRAEKRRKSNAGIFADDEEFAGREITEDNVKEHYSKMMGGVDENAAKRRDREIRDIRESYELLNRIRDEYGEEWADRVVEETRRVYGGQTAVENQSPVRFDNLRTRAERILSALEAGEEKAPKIEWLAGQKVGEVIRFTKEFTAKELNLIKKLESQKLLRRRAVDKVTGKPLPPGTDPYQKDVGYEVLGDLSEYADTSLYDGFGDRIGSGEIVQAPAPEASPYAMEPDDVENLNARITSEMESISDGVDSGRYTVSQALDEFGRAMDGIIEDLKYARDERWKKLSDGANADFFGARSAVLGAVELTGLAVEGAARIAKGVTKFADFQKFIEETYKNLDPDQQRFAWMQAKEIYNEKFKSALGAQAPAPESETIADFLPDYHSMRDEYMGVDLSKAVVDMAQKLADNGLITSARGGYDTKSVKTTIEQAKALIDKEGYLPSPEEMRKQGIDADVIITAADMANRAYLESVIDLRKKIDVETDATTKEVLQRQMLERSLMAALITRDMAGLATSAGRTLNMLKVLKAAARVGTDEMKALDFYFGSRVLEAPEDAKQQAMNLPEPQSAKALRETGTVPAVTGTGRAKRANRKTGMEGTSLLNAMEGGGKSKPKDRPALKSPSEVIAEDPVASKRMQDLKGLLRDRLKMAGKMPTFSELVPGASVVGEVADILAQMAKEYIKAGAKSFKEYRAALKKDMPGVEGSFTDEELRRAYTVAYTSEPVQAPAPREMRPTRANRPAQTVAEPGLETNPPEREGVDLEALSRLPTPTRKRQPGEALPPMDPADSLLSPAIANIESAVSRDKDVRPEGSQPLSMGDLGMDVRRTNLQSAVARDTNPRPERQPGEALPPLESESSLFAPPTPEPPAPIVDQYGRPRRQAGEEFPKDSPILTRENDELFDSTLRDATVSQERASVKTKAAQRERIDSINRGSRRDPEPRSQGPAGEDVPSLLKPGDALFNEKTREPVTPEERQRDAVRETQRMSLEIISNSQAAKTPEKSQIIADAVNAQTGMDGAAMGDTYVEAPPNESGAMIYADMGGPELKPIFLPEVAVRLQERLINTYKPPTVRHNPKGRTVQAAAPGGEKKVFRKDAQGNSVEDKTMEMLTYLGGYIWQQLPKAGKEFNAWAIRMNEALGQKINEDDLVISFNRMQKKAIDKTNEGIRFKRSAIKVARKVATVDGAAELLEKIEKLNLNDPDYRQKVSESIREYAQQKPIGMVERLMGGRALMTSGDVSALYRQLFNYTVNPYYQIKEIRKAIQNKELPTVGKMFVAYNAGWLGKWFPKAGVAGDYAETIVRAIGGGKYANLMDRFRLALTELEGMSTDVALREEQFTTGVFDVLDEAGYFNRSRTQGKSAKNFIRDVVDVPGTLAARNMVKPAERAFAVYANLARVAMFEDWVDNLVKKGYDPDIDPEVFQAATDWINDSTGRGKLLALKDTTGETLLDLEDNAKLLSSLFFSARFQTSRLKTLPILGLATIPARVGVKNLGSYSARRMALENIGSTLGGLALMGGIYGVAAIAGWQPKIETDPRSSDFMKVVVGDTRIDVWSGYVQWFRYLTQMITRQKKTESGRIENISPIYRDPTTPTLTDTTRTFFGGKMAPFPAELWNAIEGEDVIGNRKYRSDRGYVTGFKDWEDVRAHWEAGDALETAKTKAILTDPKLLWDIGGNFVPMYVPEMRKAIEHSDGRAALLNILQGTGLGVQTFYRERR